VFDSSHLRLVDPDGSQTPSSPLLSTSHRDKKAPDSAHIIGKVSVITLMFLVQTITEKIKTTRQR